MPYTMEDFRRDYVKEHFKFLTPEEQREALQSLSADERLDGLSLEEIENYLRRRRQPSPASPENRKGSRRRGQGPKR
jgi:hypothetical protein